MRRRSDNGDEMHDAFGSQGRGGSQSYGAGGGFYSAPTDRIKETNHNIMEMQNNAHIDDLSDQVDINYTDMIVQYRSGGRGCLSYRAYYYCTLRTYIFERYGCFFAPDKAMRADQLNL